MANFLFTSIFLTEIHINQDILYILFLLLMSILLYIEEVVLIKFI